MIGNNLICAICNSEGSTEGCVCNGDIILLGKNCSRDHFADRDLDHNLVDLDLAIRMQQNPSLIDHYLEEREEIMKILRLLSQLSKKVNPVKAKYEKDKQELLSRIEEILNQPFLEIEKITRDYSEKNKILSNYKASLCDEGRLLVEKFKGSGISSITNSTIPSIDIPQKEILEYLTNTLNINRPADEYSAIIAEKDRIIEVYRVK